MADVQIAVIDQQNTQLALAAPEETHVNVAVPGVQGAKGDTGTVAAAGDGTAAAPGISFANDLNTGIYRPGNDQLAISTGGTGRLFVDASGNVGIKTASPAVDLQVIGNARIGSAGTSNWANFAVVGDASIQAASGILHFTNAAGSTRFGYINHTGTGGDFYLLNQEAGAMRFGTGNSERMRIDSVGRVGIGTATPESALQVAGSTTVTSQPNVAAKIGANTTSDLLLGSLNGNSPFVASQGAYPLVFSTNAQERMRIDSSGRLGLGTSTPQVKMDIFGDSNDSILPNNSIFRFKTTGGNGLYMGTRSSSPFQSYIQSAFFNNNDNNNPYALLLNPEGGNVGIGTASPGTTLDVNGKLRLSSTEDNQLEWVSGAQTWRSNAVSGGKWYLYDATNAKFPLDVAANTTCKLDINTSHVAFTTNNSERVRIDSLGKLLKGLSSSVATLSGLGAELQVNEGSGVAFSLHRSTADANGANIVFRKTRGTSPSDVTAVATADVLGYITWMGTDGTNPISAASIIAQVDGTPGTNDMPGRLVFSTTADGASSPTERMRIKSTGIVNVGNTPVYADNAAAKTGGLVDGDIYRTSTGDLKIVYT